MFRKTGTLLTAALLGLTATIGGAGPAAAAPADAAGGTVSVGRLILEPTERGYLDSLPVTVTNTGSETDYFYLTLREPVPGAFQDTDSRCDWFGAMEENRRVFDCSLSNNWAYLAPGESRTVTLDFHVLTTPRAYPMSMTGGRIAVSSINGGLIAERSLTALFRSTTGSLIRPRPYVQDAQPDAAIDSVGPVTLDPEGTGRLYLPVTVRYKGDAPHVGLDIKASPLPAGSRIEYTIPSEGPVLTDHSWVPGQRMMPGEVRSFGLVITPPTDPADAQDVITLALTTTWFPSGPDADPSDNTAQTTLAIAATS
ncbi:hypothetical protein AB0I89_31200 [Micromonospora sp. NPDC049801]|uniref:hypothetical protein n=1 Tax=unclassified Micromonospora TaxID=2617518 RepID=UPI0033CDFA62